MQSIDIRIRKLEEENERLEAEHKALKALFSFTRDEEIEIENEGYTKAVLLKRVESYRDFCKYIDVINNIIINKTTKRKKKIRKPPFPEDISENLVRLVQKNCDWNCNTGDLLSSDGKKYEVKCFSSQGPLSFGPTAKWDILFVVDAMDFIKNNKFKVYKVDLSHTDEHFRKIPMNKKKCETMGRQRDLGRRPRISPKAFLNHVVEFKTMIFDGNITDL